MFLMFIIFYVVCVFIHVSVGTLVTWHVCRGQKTTSGVSPCFSDCLGQGLFAAPG